MKLSLTSALLCLAATSALAEKKAVIPQKSSVDTVADQHHEINAEQMAQYRPLGVMRHEYQNYKSSSNHQDYDDEEEDDGKDHSHHRSVGDYDAVEKDDGKDHSHHMGVMRHENQGRKSHDDDEEDDHDDKAKDSDKKGKEGDKKSATDKKGGNTDSVKDPKKGAEAGAGASPALADGSSKTTTTPATGITPAAGTAASVPPLWLVQPFGSSVWEQGQTYVISWGPNPDPKFKSEFKPQTPVDVRLMQGPPESLREVSVLTSALDSSLNSLQWTVPETLVPALDYSIRLFHEGDLDAYSHYFEVALKGDPRSSKSNVGEPLQMPQLTGDSPKSAIVKPVVAPNPPPAEKTEPSKPAITKPALHSSGNLAVTGESRQGANMMALALALFGAVYFL